MYFCGGFLLQNVNSVFPFFRYLAQIHFVSAFSCLKQEITKLANLLSLENLKIIHLALVYFNCTPTSGRFQLTIPSQQAHDTFVSARFSLLMCYHTSEMFSLFFNSSNENTVEYFVARDMLRMMLLVFDYLSQLSVVYLYLRLLLFNSRENQFWQLWSNIIDWISRHRF